MICGSTYTLVTNIWYSLWIFQSFLARFLKLALTFDSLSFAWMKMALWALGVCSTTGSCSKSIHALAQSTLGCMAVNQGYPNMCWRSDASASSENSGPMADVKSKSGLRQTKRRVFSLSPFLPSHTSTDM